MVTPPEVKSETALPRRRMVDDSAVVDSGSVSGQDSRGRMIGLLEKIAFICAQRLVQQIKDSCREQIKDSCRTKPCS
jgi:hypothetical protein